jgi:hypothetical protein
MSKMDEVRKWLRNLRQEPAKFSVRCDETGFTQIVQQGEDIQSSGLSWDEVTEAFAYKRDCFSVDQICIILGTADSTHWIEVREDDDGYQQFIQQLPIRIACFPAADEWLERVRLPPFAPQWTQIYVREQNHNRAG